MSALANHSFDYLYVDDLISAILHFANYSDIPAFRTYNLCSGHSDSFYSILCEVIASLGGSSSSIHMDSLTPTELDYLGNNSRFESEFLILFAKLPTLQLQIRLGVGLYLMF